MPAAAAAIGGAAAIAAMAAAAAAEEGEEEGGEGDGASIVPTEVVDLVVLYGEEGREGVRDRNRF